MTALSGSRYVFAIMLFLLAIHHCLASYEFELLYPEMRFSDRMYTDSTGDVYIIIYNEHDGMPMGVEPYFPASMINPDIACSQLYVYGFPPHLNIVGLDPEMTTSTRAIHTLQNNEFMSVFFRSRGIPPREGVRFGCEALLRQLDGDFPYYQNTVKWFMSCDPARDQYRVTISGAYPRSVASCWPLDPEREHKKEQEEEERERKRKSKDPDEDPEPKNGRKKFKIRENGKWLAGQLRRHETWSYIGSAYPGQQSLSVHSGAAPATEFEVEDSDIRYPNIFHTTKEDDDYIIIFNQNDGSPLAVEPYFPASTGSVWKACQQMYIHSLRRDQNFQVTANRVQYVKDYTRVARDIGPRSGFTFGCGSLSPDRDYEGSSSSGTGPWFMGCDAKRDGYSSWMTGTPPYISGHCVSVKDDLIYWHKELMLQADVKELVETADGSAEELIAWAQMRCL